MSLDWETLKPLIDLGLGSVALLLYYKQGKLIARLAAGVEAHEKMDQERHAAMDLRLDRLETRGLTLVEERPRGARKRLR